ncbi:hypothetical protein DID88_008819 [Monilinia fructigena]|uniref:DNA-directed RNA polymerase RBP11-like dimerisation domain-containing protein n=1 Tax=Monilinia fructigena TaxID=38457 RepID=A0A395J8Y2_9HELO|nr:hypothetical protein DID88_008819 [Monilinia fructigena]
MKRRLKLREAGAGYVQKRYYNRTDLTNMSNAPERFELFILGDGEKKCTEEADTRTPNSSIFTFNKEDHTLGNMLRAHLLKDPHVIFSGYKIPHPLFSKFELRIQTDGEITPKEALVACCRNLVSELEVFSREFTKEFELRKMGLGVLGRARYDDMAQKIVQGSWGFMVWVGYMATSLAVDLNSRDTRQLALRFRYFSNCKRCVPLAMDCP